MDLLPFLAVINFAQTVDQLNSEKMRSFQVVTPAVYQQAANTEGHIASALPVDDRTDLSFFSRDWGRWGKFVVPYYYKGGVDADSVFEASALSVWKDIQSLHQFVYSSIHLRAIKGKSAWFSPMQFPNYAMWWTDCFPTWEEGTRRLEFLVDNEENSEAFTFRNLFDPNGIRIKLSDILSKPLMAEKG